MSSRKRSLLNRANSSAAFAACLLLALSGACSREGGGVRRIAVLPFENQTADARLGWAGRALAEAVRSSILGAPAAQPSFAPTLRDAAGADVILHGYFYLSAGKLKVEAVLEDARTNRTAATASAAGSPEAILPLAAAIARQIEPRARPYSTRNETAVRACAEGLEARDPEAAGAAFARAVAADPAYGAAWVAWAQRMISFGRPAAAQPALSGALAQQARLPAVERAQLQWIAAALAGDPAAERKALFEMARATPADAGVFRGLANLDLRARAFPSAVRWYARALSLAPDDLALLNETGYAQACARDLESAVRTLSRYRDLRPRDANPLDSLGDVHFYLGRFASAASYYTQAYAKDPSFLFGATQYKAAWAHLMAGDLAHADEAFTKFIASRQAARDVSAPYRQACWEYVTGRRAQAIARMESLLRAPLPALAALAARELSIWNGKPNGCPECALLLAGKFQEAVAPLQSRRARTSPTSPDWSGVALAWALQETGRWNEAADILATNPIPDPLHDDVFLSLGFPRIFHLRAEALARQGRREDAQANARLYQKYSAAPGS